MPSRLHKGGSVGRRVPSTLPECAEVKDLIVELDNETGTPMLYFRLLGERKGFSLPVDEVYLLMKRECNRRKRSKIKKKGAK